MGYNNRFAYNSWPDNATPNGKDLNDVARSVREWGWSGSDAAAGTITINGNGQTLSNVAVVNVNARIAVGGSGDGAVSLHALRAFSPTIKVESTSNTASPAIEVKDHAATPNRWWLVSGIAGATAGDFGFYDARQGAARFSIDTNGRATINALPASTSYANDAAAATGGVAVGQVYRNGSVMMIRVS